MNLEQIAALAKRGEGKTLEFKKSTALLEGAFKTICAFLNDNGGTVLIGVTDKGHLIGQDIANTTRHDIAKEHKKIEPHADIETIFVPLEGDRQIIAINVKPGKKAPYVYDDRPFLRSQSTTIRMPRDKFEQLLFDRKPSTTLWEDLTTSECTFADLDKNRIREVVNIAIRERRLKEIAARASMEEILRKFNLIHNDLLTNAAVVLFCKNESKQFIQAELKLARFKGNNKREFIDNKAVRGNIFDLYEQAMSFLQNYLPVAGKIKEGSPFREDIPAIPYKVLRETLVNALCHRDYHSPGGSMSVAIYDDRIEIANAGGLPGNLNIKDLIKRHESRPRNPLIAHVLYACTMIERWGRGTQDILDFCKEAGNPKPKFEEQSSGFFVTLPLKEPIGGYRSSKALELTPRQNEILKLLGKMQLNGVQISGKLKNAASKRLVQLDLVKLEKAGLVKRQGEKRSITWRTVKQ